MQLNSSNMATYTTSDLPEAYLSITAAYSPASGAPTTISTSPAVVQGVYESQHHLGANPACPQFSYLPQVTVFFEDLKWQTLIRSWGSVHPPGTFEATEKKRI